MARRVTSSSKSAATLDASTRVCALIGSEEMLKREHLDHLRAAIRQTHGDFDAVFHQGASASLSQVMDDLRTYSLLQQFKLVLVDQADQFVKKHREALERYTAAPVDHAVLVLLSDAWNKGKLDNLIAKAGGIIHCDPLSPSQASAWVQKRAQSVYNAKFSQTPAQTLVDRAGTDLLRLDSELAKLILLAGPDQPIDQNLVLQNTSATNDETAFAIQGAILQAIQSSPQSSRSTPSAGGMMIEKIHDLIDVAGHNEVPVCFAVTDLLRKLYLASQLKKQGASEFSIPRQVGYWGGDPKPFLAALRMFKPHDLHRKFNRSMTSDLRNRKGLGTPLRNLECNCALLADNF